MAVNSMEHLEWDLEQTQLDNLKLHSQLRDAQTELRESQAASARNIAAQEKRLRDAGLKVSTAARVFAIPELLEHILLQLDLHKREPFSRSHASNAMQLCRLERVSHVFYTVLRSSPKLKLPKEALQLSDTPHDHAAVIWLLRELGHSGFRAADCESFNCAHFDSNANRLRFLHTCEGAGIHVKHSPDYSTAITLKAQFEQAKKIDTSWRDIRVGGQLMIYFEDRSWTYCRIRCHVSSPNGTLGELWDNYNGLL